MFWRPIAWVWFVASKGVSLMYSVTGILDIIYSLVCSVRGTNHKNERRSDIDNMNVIPYYAYTL